MLWKCALRAAIFVVAAVMTSLPSAALSDAANSSSRDDYYLAWLHFIADNRAVATAFTHCQTEYLKNMRRSAARLARAVETAPTTSKAATAGNELARLNDAMSWLPATDCFDGIISEGGKHVLPNFRDMLPKADDEGELSYPTAAYVESNLATLTRAGLEQFLDSYEITYFCVGPCEYLPQFEPLLRIYAGSSGQTGDQMLRMRDIYLFLSVR